MSRARFEEKLEELFMFDQAELDFGLYRIINSRREEIRNFLRRDLVGAVQAMIGGMGQEERAALQAEREARAQQYRDAEIPEEQIPTLKPIRELDARLAAMPDTQAVADDIFAHLVQFFSRYYHEGDFIPQRRFRRGDDAYAIPYNGEEVMLHWANRDQYYVKSGKNFRDYRFTLDDGRSVHFRLATADTERNNNKAAAGKERRFQLLADGFWQEQGETLDIFFQFQPDPESRGQNAINSATAAALRESLPPAWRNALFQTRGKSSELEYHLHRYTTDNTSDYFIHKDLGGFLRRELDSYIKNEVVRLDDLAEESEPRANQFLLKLKAMRHLGHQVIDLLAQLENFEKRLWLKKKFVVETTYCLTLDLVPEHLYPAILANDAQREEWVRLFAIDEIKPEIGVHTVGYSEPLTEQFLRENPHLVLDTRFFDAPFVDALLASFDNLDDATDGLLVHSENFQALNLLQERYSEEVECIHIDPPYNTKTSGFLYKNGYEHSSWLSMMENRISAGLPLLTPAGSFLCHIDENEYERLQLLFDALPIQNAGTVVWDKRNPMNAGRGIATQHEYVVWRSNIERPVYLNSDNVQAILLEAANIVMKHEGVTEDAKREFGRWVSKNEGLSGGEKAYRYLDEQARVYQSVSLRAPEPRTDPKFFKPLIHPVTGKACAVPPNGFSRTPETLQAMVERGEITFGADETTQPRQKMYLTKDTQRQMTSVIQDGRRGKADLAALGLDFPYNHPVSLYELLTGAATSSPSTTILDYFAGSGTTGHAVINLNREDGGRRKYILVEMGEYFDEVLKPRILKVVYSDKWDKGKPVSRQGSRHLLKIIRLESYEDTLNNLELQRAPAKSAKDKSQIELAIEEPEVRTPYLLHYLLERESRDSATLLNIAELSDPFAYTLKIGQGSAGATEPTTIDLVETFNSLIGLRVERIIPGEGWRMIRGTLPDGGGALILWRQLAALPNEQLEAFFREQIEPRLDGIAVLYVNGDNTLAALRPDGAPWQLRLIEPEFHHRMNGEA